MSEYKGLKYKIVDNVSPQGKPRVYFCCHPDDFDTYFEGIVKEIQDIQSNAAVWYYDPKEGIPDHENFYADLSQMQLFVIPVTARFIKTDNQARVKELAYAIKNHIPVLPLMQEPKLEKEFNRVCGNLQFLDKYALQKDITAIPYEEKMKKFLESVLVSDELYRKVRDAFDAYIFLSYRKKDRKYAQSIMRLIHENEFARDIAIWYDEFLTPGENFNTEIEEALEKSRLFALVVTPHLLENPNYVLTNEYPEARKKGKPIIPIEGYPTDHEALSALYKNVDPAIPAEKVAERLIGLVKDLALQKNDNDPKHNFLIGLAYLAGIDVEIDHGKALEMIIKAAESGLPEAYEKLVSMYQSGEGVKRAKDTAIRWQSEYVKYLKKTYENDPAESALKKLIKNIRNLGDYQKDTGNNAEARESFEKMLEYAEEYHERYSMSRRLIAAAFMRIGDVCKNQGEGVFTWYSDKPKEKLREAKTWYQKAYDIFRHEVQEMNTPESLRDLAVCCCKVGNVSRIEENWSEARFWYEKAYEIFQNIAQEANTLRAFRDIAVCCDRLGTIREKDCVDEARTWYQKSYDIFLDMVQKTGTLDSHKELSASFNKLVFTVDRDDNLNVKKDWYQKQYEIYQGIVQKNYVHVSVRSLSFCCRRLGDIALAEGDLREARKWYEKAYDISMREDQDLNSHRSHHDLCAHCDRLGAVNKAEGNLSEAKIWYQKAYEISQKMIQEAPADQSFTDYLGCCLHLTDLKDALRKEELRNYIEEYCRMSKYLSDSFPHRFIYREHRKRAEELKKELDAQSN